MEIHAISVNNHDKYSIEEAAKKIGLSPVQIQYWIKKKAVPQDEKGRITGQYVLMMYIWQEQKNVEDSIPATPREKFFKLVDQLSFLANSKEGGLLFGDYRVNEFYQDIIDLLVRFKDCHSVQRIQKDPHEIHEIINHAIYTDIDNTDFTQFEGNFTNSDAAHLYHILKGFRIKQQGQEIAKKNFLSAINEDISENGFDCKVNYKELDDGLLEIQLDGSEAQEVAKRHITGTFNGERHYPLGFYHYLIIF